MSEGGASKNLVEEKVLIIEDNPDIFYLFDILLRNSGYATIHATNGRQGIEFAQQARPDLILMDIQMREMDGYEATRLLKASPSTSNIPIIGVSAYATSESRQQALNAGMVGYIEKPIIPEIFLTQIKACLP